MKYSEKIKVIEKKLSGLLRKNMSDMEHQHKNTRSLEKKSTNNNSKHNQKMSYNEKNIGLPIRSDQCCI